MMENNTAPTVAATTGEQQQQQQQQVNSNTDKKSMTTTTSPSAQQQQQQQQQQQLSLSVSFRNFDEIIPHISIQCLVKDEVDRTWYSATEISTIRQACNEMARAIPLVDCFRHEEDEENALPSNSNTTTNAPAEQEQQAVVCLRGLEHRTYEGARIRMRRKLNAWGAVDNEQDRQWDEGYVDEESLAEMYRSCTVDSMRDAQLMALRDESFVVRHGGGVGLVLREGLMVVQ